MKLGFTGSQIGMNERQLLAFEELIIRLHPTEFHHGDCIGADEQAQAIVAARIPSCKLVIHPPTINSKRAWCPGELRAQKPYLKRNQDIVDECTILIATPSGPERLRSGTWSTVRYARRTRGSTAVMVINPDGQL